MKNITKITRKKRILFFKKLRHSARLFETAIDALSLKVLKLTNHWSEIHHNYITPVENKGKYF